jgi:molecular chaperone GrpE
MADEIKQEDMQDQQATDQAPQEQSGRLRWRRRGNDAGKSKDAGAADADGAADEVNDLQEQVLAERAKAEELKQQVLRAQADFVNYKRRVEQDKDQQARQAAWTIVKDIVPILDNLDLTLANMPEEVRGLSWTDGLMLVDRQLRATLEKQGLRPIEAMGATFDPTLHEAILHEESTEHADNEIMAELRRGYWLNDRVVRPTLVKVAKHVDNDTQAQTQEGM